jgi:hypothetical protein
MSTWQQEYNDELLYKEPVGADRLSGLELFEEIFKISWEESETYRSRLPLAWQDVLTLIFKFQKTQTQTAEILGYTQGNIPGISAGLC